MSVLQASFASTMPVTFDGDFVDFDSAAAHQYSVNSDEWAISELDEEALGIKSTSTKSTSASTTSSAVQTKDTSMKCLEGFRSRPSMISPKYRLKEERRKVLKISVSKLKKIEDPESSLRRSVLINNTMKRLQRESRDDKKPVSDVLSQLYMPPTPRMLTCIDDDDADEQPPAKRPKLEPDAAPADDHNNNTSSGDDATADWAQDARFEPAPAPAPAVVDEPFSCAQASMFGELQSVVFHSLIASLES